jgi:regulator of protease activity HflC (stomatin/prohibitin superfamily)
MYLLIGLAIAIVLIGISAHIAQEYQRAIVFRLGRYSRTAGPGFTLLSPL